ncbi:protein LEAD-SENSITIVE 1-like [Cornus florida]|uniref:protein LEAD-SENSITIVE 1-like n=1 Tax=Cornus florida TaxID=4283 RepID=UPI00289FD80A|nr:protein LEAD-SENSITIVE 1-like [Cornus florida]
MGIREVWSNKISREELSAGDHIYSWRGSSRLFAHHGIYAGGGMVIHFTRGADQEFGIRKVDRVSVGSAALTSFRHSVDNPCPSCGYHSMLNGVISSCIDCFLSDGELYLYRYGVSWTFYKAKLRRGTCTRKPSDTPNVVLARAQSFLATGFGDYHIVNNNCENFAITCKTGEGIGIPNGQAKFLLKISPWFAASVPVTVAVLIVIAM